MEVVRAPWTTASFLLYAGGLAILVSAVAFLGLLAGDSSDAAFVGWAALTFALLAVVAQAFRRAGRPVSAGLFALSSVVAFVVLFGAVENWLGWLASVDAPFNGFHVGNLLVSLVAVVAALVARRRFRFPLLTLIALVGLWYLLTDMLSNGGWWSAVVTLLFGLSLLLIGIDSDRVYGFWMHVVAGLTIGGSLLYFWHSSDLDWVLVALGSLAYFALASGLARSSYAVLGAFGLWLVTTHFVLKWFVPFTISFVGNESPPKAHAWAAALSYSGYGLVLMLIALWIARRRQPPEPL